jgi:hypothetical protein
MCAVFLVPYISELSVELTGSGRQPPAGIIRRTVADQREWWPHYVLLTPLDPDSSICRWHFPLKTQIE